MGKLGLVLVTSLATIGIAAAQPVPPPFIPTYGEPLGLETAKRVMAAAEAQALKEKVSPTIVVMDSTSHIVLYEKLDNSDYGNGEIAVDMARSATEFRRPTSEFVEGVKLNPGEGFLKGVVPFSGGWPIVVDGKLVGSIGLTGSGSAPGATARIAQAGIAAVHGRPW